MITNQDKINIIINKLNNLELSIQSYILHAEDFKNKYSLEEELLKCNIQKTALLNELHNLGGQYS